MNKMCISRRCRCHVRIKSSMLLTGGAMAGNSVHVESDAEREGESWRKTAPSEKEWWPT